MIHLHHKASPSHSQLLGFQVNPLSKIPLSINLLHSHLHLIYIYIYKLVTLVPDIRLNTLTFMFLTTSEAYNFAYESFISLQLPLHLFTSVI